MVEITAKHTRLRMEYTDSFGYNTIVETDVQGDTLDELMSSVKQCIHGFGFSESSIAEYIPD